jgi:hypothetical protein
MANHAAWMLELAALVSTGVTFPAPIGVLTQQTPPTRPLNETRTAGAPLLGRTWLSLARSSLPRRRVRFLGTHATSELRRLMPAHWGEGDSLRRRVREF